MFEVVQNAKNWMRAITKLIKVHQPVNNSRKIRSNCRENIKKLNNPGQKSLKWLLGMLKIIILAFKF